MKTSENLQLKTVSIFGLENSGKCSLSKGLSISYGSIAKPNEFHFDNVTYSIFPIPCTQPDFLDNFEISILNSTISLLVIDSTKPLDFHLKDNQEYYKELLSQIVLNDIKKIIVCFNKIDKNSYSDNELKQIKDFLDSTLVNFNKFYPKQVPSKIYYVFISATESQGLNELVKAISEDVPESVNENFVLRIFDLYNDNEEGTFVISGKVISGQASLESNLSFLTTENYPNSSTSITPFKICKSNGVYMDKAKEKEFITIKFKKEEYENQKTSLKKSSLIVSKNCTNVHPIFDTFEADLFIISSPIPVISKGFTFVFSYYSSNLEAQIEAVVGKYENDAFIKKSHPIPCIYGAIGKVIIKVKEPIIAEKYEISNVLGVFSIKKEGKVIGIGKINKYKKYK